MIGNVRLVGEFKRNSKRKPADRRVAGESAFTPEFSLCDEVTSRHMFVVVFKDTADRSGETACSVERFQMKVADNRTGVAIRLSRLDFQPH